MILLKDKSRCPCCGAKSIRWDKRKCGECDANILLPGDTGSFLTDQLIKSWYVWTGERGFVHSDHFLNGEKPNLPDARQLTEPDKNYGHRKLPPGCSAG